MKKENDILEHYGMPRRSGRYPWGSGKESYQHTGDFLSRYEQLKAEGMKSTDISEALGMSTTTLRAKLSLAKRERRAETIARIRALKEDGMSNVGIAAELNLRGESTVRSLLNEDSEARMKIAEKTALDLKTIVDEKGMIDIGTGVERQLGISKEKMKESLEILKLEGYEVYGGRVPQVTNIGKHTTLKVLAIPGTPHKAIYQYDKIGSLNDYISTDGESIRLKTFEYPSSMDSSRMQVRYSEEGGTEKDGIIEIRRGVDDLSLGNANYAQVRILVDDTHYLKGMAVYTDKMPDGIDVIFNTNKSNSVSKIDTLKKIKDDPENPFGSSIKELGGQSNYISSDGTEQLSLINKRADEGDWGQWSNKLSSQFLSKQPMKLIKKQLYLAEKDKEDEYKEILSLTNPTVKKALLVSFSDDCDAAAVDLKAASLPGQTYKVILPIPSLKNTEAYAPHLEDGSQIALVRYPHGGTFEIPILTVNNRNREAIDILTTNPSDAIGINANVANRLSGADFDGDTVMVIPLNDSVKIKTTPPLKQLEGFDPTMQYGPDTMKMISGEETFWRGKHQITIMKETSTQAQMGKISNLITDMTLKGASQGEIARAVKHSMVVIDAVKHHLDYKQSGKDNGISALHNKYQAKDDPTKKGGGASTLISKASSEARIGERKEGAFFAKDSGNELLLIDTEKKLYFDQKTNKVYSSKDKKTVYIHPETGVKLYHDTNRSYTTVKYTKGDGKSGKSSIYILEEGKYKIPKKDVSLIKGGHLYFKNEQNEYTMVTNEHITTKLAIDKSTKMAETSDARTLSSGTPQEEAYASYANKLKSLGNTARKELIIIQDIPYSPSARRTYLVEVDSLNHKLNQALLNAPKERRAQTIAASIIRSKKQENPTMTNEQEKKLRQQELSRARAKVGAKRNDIQITEKEWESIQAGAISKTRLGQIIANADLDILRQLAMPRERASLSPNKIRRIANMALAGYTTAEIARALGISPSTVNKYLKGDE